VRGAPLKSMSHVSQGTRQIVDQLIDKARSGNIEGARRALSMRCVQNPAQAADMLLLLALHVADLDQIPDEEDRAAYLRRMHAAYERCKDRPQMRTRRVVEGEREYQRLKARRYRARRKAA